MTVKELSDISGINEKTIIKNYKKIPGMQYLDNKWILPDGSRYPYNLRRNQLKNIEDRVCCLLKATADFKYVDHKMLKMPKEPFDRVLKDLVEYGVLEENDLVYTSGLGNLPANIYIGKVKSVSLNNTEIEKVILVDINDRLEKLDYVFVRGNHD